MNTIARGIAFTLIASGIFAFSSALAASRNSADLLKYIPADTPYAFASTEPMPDKVADKLEPTIDELLKAYQKILRHAMSEQLLKMTADEDDGEDVERFRAVAEEILGLLSLDGIRGIGIARDSAFAMYGNGLLPVVRVELSDADLFDAAIARIEKKAGHELAVGEVDDNDYKYLDLDKMRLVIATLESQLVVTVYPREFDEAQVSRALGLKTPRKSVKSNRSLTRINKEYGFSDFMTGYVDAVRIAEIFTGGATGLDQDLFAVLEFEPPELSKVCNEELMDIVGIAPRVVFGYSKITQDDIHNAMIVEMRKDIAEGLATLPTPVPGLGLDPGGLGSFGISMNMLHLREFYEARLDAMEADPFECEMFADLQGGVAKGREALQQPVPPVVYSFRGFVANVTDIEGMDLTNDDPPESIDATLLFAVENAEALLMMAAMLDPQIAALNLVPDGKPVKLELAQLATVAEQAYAALTNNALSLAIGNDAEEKAADVLVAKSADSVPFLSMSMDSARYYALMGEAMLHEESQSETEPLPLEMREALRDVMVLSGSIYDRLGVNVHFTERGIEIDGRMTLSD